MKHTGILKRFNFFQKSICEKNSRTLRTSSSRTQGRHSTRLSSTPGCCASETRSGPSAARHPTHSLHHAEAPEPMTKTRNPQPLMITDWPDWLLSLYVPLILLVLLFGVVSWILIFSIFQYYLWHLQLCTSTRLQHTCVREVETLQVDEAINIYNEITCN